MLFYNVDDGRRKDDIFMYQRTLNFETSARGWIDIGGAVNALIGVSEMRHGLCHVFLRHTSAALIITENADPDVRRDLERWMLRAVPDGDPMFVHDAEGDDDMPAHVRNALLGCERTIPFADGRLLLGTWQGLYLWEARSTAHHRRVVVTLSGE